MAKTTIEVSDDTWSRLNRQKERGQSFDDVIQEVLDSSEKEVA